MAHMGHNFKVPIRIHERYLQIILKFARPCSPTLGQVDWFSWKAPLSQSHPVPPNLKTHLSLLIHLILRPPCPSPILSHPLWRPPCPSPTCTKYWNLSHPDCTTCPFPTFFFSVVFTFFSLGFWLSFHYFLQNTVDWNFVSQVLSCWRA